jgi:hypothetical protein
MKPIRLIAITPITTGAALSLIVWIIDILKAIQFLKVGKNRGIGPMKKLWKNPFKPIAAGISILSTTVQNHIRSSPDHRHGTKP